MSNSLIGRFEHLRNRPKSDDALPLLEKIASQVKPIMTKRSWKVGTLAEFLPSNPALLGNNMNAGQRINLRLRPPGDHSTFYEYEQLVLVMLHELTHIEHGPHDAKFYKLLAEVEEEYYDLKRKGYSGEGFHGSGNHLSGFKVPEYVGKAKGLQAAEKRLAVQIKIGKGGVLGGSSVAGRNVREVLAEAAERRIRDDKACHTDTAEGAKEVEEEVRKAQAESEGVNASDLPNYEPSQTHLGQGGVSVSESGPSSQPPSSIPGPIQPSAPISPQPLMGKSSKPPPPPPLKQQKPSLESDNGLRQSTTSSSSTSSASSSRPTRVRAGTNPKPKPEVIDLTTDDEWSCPTCTLLNPDTNQSCEACTTSRPFSITSNTNTRTRSARSQGSEVGWYCDFCGSGPREMSFWSCAECGTVRKWG